MTKEKKGTKVKRVKEVVYPILQECCSFFKDDFWIKLFDDLSRGRCPKGISIYKDVISSTYKRNGFTYTFMGDGITAAKIVEELPNILKNTVCIFSSKDIINKKVDFSTANSDYLNIMTTDNWKKIKNKKMRENLLINFAISMKKKYKMNVQSTKNLYTLIKYCVLYDKTHTADDIIMKDGEVVKIEGIEYDKKEKVFVNTKDKESYETVSEKEKTDYLKNKWETFVSTLIKEIIKIN